MTGSAITRIKVGGDSPYDVVVGEQLLADGVLLRALLGADVRRAALIHPPPLSRSAQELAQTLDSTMNVILIEVPDGEAAKTVAIAADAWSQLGRAGFTRSDAVIGLGGGATTDLAGFIGATWLRGVRVVHVPTTLLGMVDAAVGGKTAINTPAGKNLVGAFHPPAGVVCDLATLTTLPREDLVSGMAEVVKAGFISDVEILNIIESDVAAALSTGPYGRLRELVERSVRVKADVVASDLRERGGREILNYGHTLGHAIEKVEDFTLRHGEAVSVGMVFAAELSRAAGRLSEDDVARHRAVLTSLSLPTSYRSDRWEQLLDTMQVDKKTRGSVLRFVILEGVGRPMMLEDPDAGWLTTAYEKVCL